MYYLIENEIKKINLEIEINGVKEQYIYCEFDLKHVYASSKQTKNYLFYINEKYNNKICLFDEEIKEQYSEGDKLYILGKRYTNSIIEIMEFILVSAGTRILTRRPSPCQINIANDKEIKDEILNQLKNNNNIDKMVIENVIDLIYELYINQYQNEYLVLNEDQYEQEEQEEQEEKSR